jgi:hypothetical protein
MVERSHPADCLPVRWTSSSLWTFDGR